ncbi:MAG: sensor histidine kinase [Desulfuromonas thiophila]|jgi:signal transduction histidine kinase|nr:sensor histidine kinase [Desulfuromonas thiophila]
MSRINPARLGVLATLALLLLLPLLLPLGRVLVPAHQNPAPIGQQLLIENAASRIALRGHLAQWLDDAHRHDIDAIRQLPEETFSPLSGDVNVGYRDTVVWLRFTLQRRADAPALWWLEVNPAFLDQVTLYRASPPADEGREIRIDRDWSKRSIPHRTALFAIELPADQSETFYLRIENATALFVRPVLWQPQAYLKSALVTALLHGGLFITAIAIVLINLFYWHSLRQRLFLAYVAFVGSVALLLFQSEGYLLLLWQPEQPFPAKLLQGLTQVVTIASFYAVFLALVEPQRRWPLLTRWLSRTTWLFTAAMVLLLLSGQPATAVPALWGYLLFLSIFDALLCVRLAADNDRRAINYLLCFSVLMVSAGLRVAFLFGWLPNDFNFSHVCVWACLIHWVLLQMVVIDQIRQIRREHERAREEALALSRAMKSELGLRVEQRTEALRQTSQQLQQQLQERGRLMADLEQTRQALQQSLEYEKEINAGHHQFLRLVGHEFRTPLNVIAGSAELLSESDDASVRERALARLGSAIRRIRELVDQALRQDRQEGSVWRATMAPFALEGLLTEVADYGRSVDPNHRIEAYCPHLRIQADRELLSVALHNLLDNASKYAPPHSRIRLTGAFSDTSIRVTVADQGEVIPPQEGSGIFTRYYRRQGQNQPGLGLGLYLVDHIARLHGGSVRLESDHPTGNRFIIELPHSPSRH